MKLYVFIFLMFVLATCFLLHPFLAITKPVKSKVMVIESWLPDDSLKFAANLFHKDKYSMILVVGESINNITTKQYNIEQCKEKLIRMGIDENKITTIHSDPLTKGHTYSYARAISNWITLNKPSIKSFNVVTHGTHARKSYILFRKVLNSISDVGVISAPPTAYNSHYWFFSTIGISFVSKNSIGYLYAIFL